MEEFEDLCSLQDLGDEIDDGDGDIMGNIAYATTSNKRCGPRGKPVNRTEQTELWSCGYVNGNWDENSFEPASALRRTLLSLYSMKFIQKIPTNFQPNPIDQHRQLGFTLYSLAEGFRSPMLLT